MQDIQEKISDKTNIISNLGVGGKYIIVGIGEILWDVLPTGKVLGGAPANFAYHVSQFGFDGYAISAIGEDELGKEILENVNNKELNYIIEKTPFSTGTVQVTLNNSGLPQYEICENVAWDNIPFTSEMQDLAHKTSAVCFGSLAQRNIVSRTTINRFIDCVPKTALKIFDINLRQHFYSIELIEQALSTCNILKINDEEIVIISKLFGWETKSEIQVARLLLKNYSLKMVVLTCGTLGSSIISENEISFIPTPMVDVADTVGAGDSFTAALIAAILKGKNISEAHQLAVEVSAYVCTQHGAMPIMTENFRMKIGK